jgi:Tfp pilus assembly protein PilF/predicted aspartyl protease
MRRAWFALFLPLVLAVAVAGQETVSSSSSSSPSSPLAPAAASTSAPLHSMPELLALGLEAYRTGKFDDAVEKYQSVLQQDPKSADAYAGLVRVYLKQEKIDTANEIASKGVIQAPDSAAAHTALGEVYFRQGKMEDGEREFLKSVNTAHPEARAYLGLSRLYDALSLHAKARKMLEKAHALDAEDPDVQRRWISTLSRSERMRSLEQYLATPKGDDTETRERMQRYLNLLKERQKHPEKSCRLVSKLAATETDLKPLLIDPRHLRGYGLEVKVNGRSSRLLLDTGASGLLINRRMAEKAGLTQLSAIKIGGIGDKGDAEGYVAYADSVKVGNLEFQNCLVDVADKRSLADEDGLIGADVFSHYLVTIDFPNQKLKLQELPKRPDEVDKTATLSTMEDDGDDDEEASSVAAQSENQKIEEARSEAEKNKRSPHREPHDRYVAPEMKSYTTIWLFGHDLLIPTKVGDSSARLFLIDTGSWTNFISPAAAREVTKVHGSDMRVKGISGSVKNVYEADKAVLQFSRFRQENQDITALDLSKISKADGTEVSGILGFTTLRLMSLKIDYRDGLVDFDYDAQRWH